MSPHGATLMQLPPLHILAVRHGGVSGFAESVFTIIWVSRFRTWLTRTCAPSGLANMRILDLGDQDLGFLW